LRNVLYYLLITPIKLHRKADMNILLTGGAGFIGSHVADALLEDGNRVAIIDDLSTGRRENVPHKASFHKKSITDPDLSDVFIEEQPDVVIHHAAQISVSSSVKNPIGDMEINIKGTLQLLETAVKHGIKKFIFASTGGAIYGEHDYFPADENHPVRPLSPYGIAKLAVEKYLFFYYTTHGLPYTTLRYSNVYGPRQDPYGEAGVVAVFTMKMLAGADPTINGTGEQTRDFVFVKDVAGANLLAVRHNVVGEFNISTARETTINDVFSILQTTTGARVSETHGPAMPGEQMRSVIAWGKAQKQLGWSPATPLQDGLYQTVQYFKQRGETPCP